MRGVSLKNRSQLGWYHAHRRHSDRQKPKYCWAMPDKCTDLPLGGVETKLEIADVYENSTDENITGSTERAQHALAKRR